MPDRHRQIEQRLQQPVDVAGGEQIGAARDQRDPVRRIIQRGGKVIARRRILAHQHDIAQQVRRGLLRPRQLVGPDLRAGQRQRFCHVQPPCRAGRIDVPAAAGAGVDRPVRPAVRGRSGHFGAGAMARIKQAQRLEPRCRSSISGDPARLADNRPVPVQIKPRQVSKEFLRQVGAAALTVDILDPQQKFAARRPGQIMRDDRRIGMAQMQRAIGTGGEAGADHAPRGLAPSDQPVAHCGFCSARRLDQGACKCSIDPMCCREIVTSICDRRLCSRAS